MNYFLKTKRGFTPVKYKQSLSFGKAKNFTGFTLIETLIVIGIIIILAGVIVITINPGQRLAEARDSQRVVHLNAVLHAVESKILQERGVWDCDPIPAELTLIGKGTGEVEEYDLYECLWSEYLAEPLIDPTKGVWTDKDNYNTNYKIAIDAYGNIHMRAEGETKEIVIGKMVEPEFSILTQPAVSIGETSATLRGEISDLAGADSADVWFDYGTTENLGGGPVGQTNMSETGEFTYELTGLDESTKYYFQAQGEDVGGETDEGTIRSFTTGEDVAEYTLTIKIFTDGVEDDTGGSTSPSKGTHSYPDGETVTVSTSASSGYVFEKWEEGCTGTGSCEVTMDENKTVEAYFVESEEEVDTYSLTITADGPGTTNPESGYSYVYNANTDVPIDVAPDYGYDAYWSGSASGTGNITVRMDSDKSVHADFLPREHDLKLTSSVGGGTDPKSGYIYRYYFDDVVTITAGADGGYHAFWDEECYKLEHWTECTLHIVEDYDVHVEFENGEGVGENETFTKAVDLEDMAILDFWLANQSLSQSIANNQESMNYIASEQTAMEAAIASATFWSEAVGSSTAMNEIAGSQTAMDVVAYNTTAMVAVAGSQTAMDSIYASSLAMDTVVLSDTAMAVFAPPNKVVFTGNVKLNLTGLDEEVFITDGTKVDLLKINSNIAEITKPMKTTYRMDTGTHMIFQQTNIQKDTEVKITISTANETNGYIDEWEVESGGHMGFKVGVPNADTDYTVKLNGAEIAGSPFNSGGDAVIEFTNDQIGTYTIE